MEKQYDVAAYVWPAYTGKEPRAKLFWPDGEGEWQTVRRAGPKFEGHRWPRTPLWGYRDEADPAVMEEQIDQAADHGVNVFIYDWYWYDRRPFLEQCLNDGFLQARNRSRMRFYLMWANHDARYVWDIRNAEDWDTVIWEGRVDRPEFERIARRLIRRYFHLPEYYTIGGKPVFAVYDLKNLAQGLGGLEETRDALQWFREECVRWGLPGLHLQFIKREPQVENHSGLDEAALSMTPELAARIGADSLTHYQYVHFLNIDREYGALLPELEAQWRLLESFGIPYFPHVSLGWDNNPRFRSFLPGILRDNTPDRIREALRLAKGYVDRHPEQPPLVIVNSWNEWTEASYLQPDSLYGYGYLDAVREVFGQAE